MANEIEPSAMHDNSAAASGTQRMISDFKIQNQNSVYYLKPTTQDLYLLDLTKRAFLKQ